MFALDHDNAVYVFIGAGDIQTYEYSFERLLSNLTSNVQLEGDLMEAPIRIRQADLSDWEEILAIEQLNFPAAEALVPRSYQRADWADSRYFFVTGELHSRWRATVLDQLFRRDIWQMTSLARWVLAEGASLPSKVCPSIQFSEAGVGTLLLAAQGDSCSAKSTGH